MNWQLLRIILYNQKQPSPWKQYDAAYRRHKCKNTVLASEAAILNCSEKNAITIWSKNLWGFIFRMFLKKCLAKIWFLITAQVDIEKVALREKGPYWEMFSSVLSLIWTEYGEILLSVVSPNAGKYEI